MSKDGKIKVHCIIPCYDGKPYSEVLINIFQQELPENVELEFSRRQIIDGLPVQLARNQGLFNFLRKSDADYLRQIDADNPCDLTTLKNMLEHKVDAISAVVPLRFGPLRYCIVKDGKPITSFEGLGGPLVECDNIGTGCCLLSRRLCEDVWKLTEGHPYQFRVSDYILNINGKPEEYESQDMIPGWRDKYQAKDGKIHKVKRMIGEDLWFGEQAQKLGYKFYADLRAHCYHFTSKSDKRVVANEDCLISESFNNNEDIDDSINYNTDFTSGEVSGESIEEYGEVEVRLLGDNNSGE